MRPWVDSRVNLTTNMTDQPDMQAAELQVATLLPSGVTFAARLSPVVQILSMLHHVAGPALVWDASSIHYTTRKR